MEEIIKQGIEWYLQNSGPVNMCMVLGSAGACGIYLALKEQEKEIQFRDNYGVSSNVARSILPLCREGADGSKSNFLNSGNIRKKMVSDLEKIK